MITETEKELIADAISSNDITTFCNLIEDIPIETKLDNGNTALIYAAAYGCNIIVQSLLDAGANIEATNNDGDKPLMAASAGNYIDVIKLLLDAGADKDAQNLCGSTPLMWAVYSGCVNATQTLLTAGANQNIINQGNRTASMIANMEGYDEIEFILNYFGTFRYRLYTIGFNETTIDKKLNSKEKRLYQSLICPISCDIMNDPITLSNGITYDRESLQKYFSSHGNPISLPCPQTRLLIQDYELQYKTCFALKAIIEDFISDQESAFQKRMRPNTENISTQMSNNFKNFPKIKQEKLIIALSRNASFFKRVENIYLQESRHADANLQHEYDKRFGLIIKQ